MKEINQLSFVITGASGYVGKHLVNHLKNFGSRVTVLQHRQAYPPAICPADLKVVEGDVLGKKALEELIHDADVVVHLAAYVHKPSATKQQIEQSYQVNFQGTKNIIDACLKIQHPPFFIFLSTVSVYGETAGEAVEDQACHPNTVYGKAKLAAENYLLSQIAESRLHGCVLRSSSILGEHAPGNLSKLIRWMKTGFFPVFNQGMNRKSLIHIDDVIQGIISAAENIPISNGQIYNLSAESPLTFSEIQETIAQSLGKRVLLIHLPLKPFLFLFSIWDRIAALSGGKLPLLRRNLEVITSEDVVSIDKIRVQLGFQPQYSAEEGIITMVNAIR
jgi:UDP-glucose 4-epimerase